MNNHDRYNYNDRPNTAQLVDLHIYVVPPELWSEHRNSAVREVINDTISAGFIRVQPETNINGLREEIENQLGGEHMPNDYVFLRSVGRCMTRIRPKQEYQLKVRNFTPPQSYAPEIFVLEASLWRDHRYSGASSSMRSDRSDFSGHPVIPPITDKNKMMQTARGQLPSPPPHLLNPPLPPHPDQAHPPPHSYNPPLPPNPTHSPPPPHAHDPPLPPHSNHAPPPPHAHDLALPPHPNHAPPPPHAHKPPHDAQILRIDRPKDKSTQTQSSISIVPQNHPRTPSPSDKSAKHVTWSPRHSNVYEESEHSQTNKRPRSTQTDPTFDGISVLSYAHKHPPNPGVPPLALETSPSPTSRRTRNAQRPEQQQQLNGSHRPAAADEGGSRSPLSATPHGTPERTTRQVADPGGGGEYLPPVSATPPRSPEGFLANKPKLINNTSSEDLMGISDLEDRRRLEETIRRRIEEEETLRRRDREERENESRRRELEEKRRFDDERNEVERRRREEEDRRRREEEDRRSREEEDRRSREEEARRSREEEDRRSRDEEEKRRRDEEERRSREEDDRRRRDEEDRKKREDEEWKNKEEYNRRKYDDDKRRDDHAADDEERWRIEEEERRRMEEEQRWVVEEEERRRRTEVETTRYVINDGDEKAKILRELEELREGRVKMEQDREEMVKRIKGLQGKSSTRRNQARDVWKKKYFDEKKRTPAHEEKTNKLRQELENLHRRIMSTMEGNSDGKTPRHGGDPSTASNLKIQATKYQHELDELHRKVENIKMRLTAEMKLRTQAETELRALRAELTQKKINVTLTRSQQYQAIGIAPPLDSYPAAHAVTPRT